MGFSSKLTDNRLKSELKEMWKERNADLSDSLDELGIIVRTNGAFVSPGQVMEEYGRLEAFLRRLRDNWGSRTCFSCLYRALPSYSSSLRGSGFGRLGSIIDVYKRQAMCISVSLAHQIRSGLLQRSLLAMPC